jgi:hypothetical protein
MAMLRLCVTQAELEQFMFDTGRTWEDLRKMTFEELNGLCKKWLEQKQK